MKMKKLCAMLLASAMALSLAACGSGGDSGKESAEKQESSSQQEESKESEKGEESSAAQEGEDGGQAASGNEGGLVPMEDADDPITYTFFVRDPGQAPADDNPVIQKITELTGVTLKFEYLVGDLDQKLGTMIAGGDYPDIIFAGDAATKLMDAGAFIPLEDEIPKYPNLNAMYGDVMKYLTQADGHVYNMEIYGTFQNDVTEVAPPFECSIGFYIQKAVL